MTKSKLLAWLESLDLYGRPVTLSFRGKDKFRTLFGGIVSFLLLSLILSVFIYKLMDMLQRSQTQIKKNTLVSISNSYTQPEVISEKNITIAFMLSDFYGDGSFDDPKYGKFVLQ